jgi:hypothetical protein
MKNEVMNTIEARASVEGKIESRGVGLIYPVGGEPGARAKIGSSQANGCLRKVRASLGRVQDNVLSG